MQPEISDISGSLVYGGLLSFPKPLPLLNLRGLMLGGCHHFKPTQENPFEKPNNSLHCLFPQIENNHWGPLQIQVTPQFTWDFGKEIDFLTRISLPLGQLSRFLSYTHFGVWGSVQKGAALEGKQKLWKNLYFKVNGQVLAWWKAQKEKNFCIFLGLHWELPQEEALLDLLQDTMAVNWDQSSEATPLITRYSAAIGNEELCILPASDFEALKHNLEEHFSKISLAWKTESAGEIQVVDKVSPELLMPPLLCSAYAEYLKGAEEIINTLTEIPLNSWKVLHRGTAIPMKLDVVNKEQFQEIERLTQIQYDATRKKEKREKFSHEMGELQNLQASLNRAYQGLTPQFLDHCCDLISLNFSKNFPNPVDLSKIEADFEKIQSELQEVSKALHSLEKHLETSNGNRTSELAARRLKIFQEYLNRNLDFVDRLSERVTYSAHTLELLKRGHAILKSFFKTTQELHQYWADYTSKWRTKATNILEKLSLHSGSTRFQQWEQLNSQRFYGFEMWPGHIRRYEGENYLHLIEYFSGYPLKILEETFMNRFMKLFQLIQQELKDLEKKHTPEAFSELIKSVSAQVPEGWTKYKGFLKNKIFLQPIEKLKNFMHRQLGNMEGYRSVPNQSLHSGEIIAEDDFRIKWLKLYGITPKVNGQAENARRWLSSVGR